MAEQLFSVANTIALLAWLLLAALPGRRWVTDVMTGKVIPIVFASLTLSTRNAAGTR